MEDPILQACREKAEEIQKKVNEYRYWIFDANPFGDMIALRKEGYKLMQECGDDHKKTLELLEPLVKREKKINRDMKIWKKYRGTEQIDILCNLEQQLSKLNMEIAIRSHRKNGGS